MECMFKNSAPGFGAIWGVVRVFTHLSAEISGYS
jgi:hypothetical protein